MTYPSYYPKSLIEDLDKLAELEAISMANPNDLEKSSNVKLKLMEVYGEINSCYTSGLITKEEADSIRDIYYWSKL